MLWRILVIVYFCYVKFIFTRGRIKPDLLIETQSSKFWSYSISILTEVQEDAVQGYRGGGWKWKLYFWIFFFLPVLWDQYPFLHRSPLLSVGTGDKIDPLLENIKASSPSCIHLSYLLFECHISGIRPVCFPQCCAQDAFWSVLRAACWDQCHRVEWGSLPHMPDGGTSPPDPASPALV